MESFQGKTKKVKEVKVPEPVKPKQTINPYMSNAQMAKESSWAQYFVTHGKFINKQNEVNSLYFESFDAQNRLQNAKNIRDSQYKKNITNMGYRRPRNLI